MPYDLERMCNSISENEIKFERPTLHEACKTVIGYLIQPEETRATRRPSLKNRMAAELIRQYVKGYVELEYDPGVTVEERNKRLAKK